MLIPIINKFIIFDQMSHKVDHLSGLTHILFSFQQYVHVFAVLECNFRTTIIDNKEILYVELHILTFIYFLIVAHQTWYIVISNSPQTFLCCPRHRATRFVRPHSDPENINLIKLKNGRLADQAKFISCSLDFIPKKMRRASKIFFVP